MSDRGASWDAYWQGKEGGSLKTQRDAARDAELVTFWQEALQPLDRDAAFLDLACGSGVVLKTAQDMAFQSLHGVDIAESAITALTTMLPDVAGKVSSAAQTDYPDHHFSSISSQFGMEYAGFEAAAKEAARLLAPGGTVIAVCHLQEGPIHEDAEAFLAHSRTIADSRYIDLSRDLFQAFYGNDQDGLNAAIADLSTAREQVATLITHSETSLASHLVLGAGQLWERREHYLLEDVIGWLDGMEAQRAAFELRMQDMLNASLSDEDVQKIGEIWREQGLEAAAPRKLTLLGEPTAWVLQATRPD